MARRRVRLAAMISCGIVALALLVDATASGLGASARGGTSVASDELSSPSGLPAEAARLSRSAVRWSNGCRAASELVRGGTSQLYVESGGRVRSYLLHVPTTYRADRPSPLIVAFHGRGRTPQLSETTTGLSGAPAIVAYPEGVANRIGKLDWEVSPEAAPGVDDVALTGAVIDRTEATMCVDRDRVYAVGHSDGGGFAVAVACALGHRIAAVVSVAGAYYDKPTGCASPIALLELHSVGDAIVRYGGSTWRGARLPAISSFMRAQARVNQCAPEPRRSVIRSRAVDFRWVGCASGRPVEHIRIGNRFHRVPTSRDLGGISFTVLAWRFLRKQSLPSSVV